MHDRSPVTTKVVVPLMRAALSHIGHPHSDLVTIHSLRRGAVKDAQDSGTPVNQIMELGVWSSKAGIKPYLIN